jgi:hypothetical protein
LCLIYQIGGQRLGLIKNILAIRVKFLLPRKNCGSKKLEKETFCIQPLAKHV